MRFSVLQPRVWKVFVEVIEQASPEGDHAANGLAEFGVREVKAQTRVLKSHLEESLKKQLDWSEPLATWLVRNSAIFLSRYRIQVENVGDVKLSSLEREMRLRRGSMTAGASGDERRDPDVEMVGSGLRAGTSGDAPGVGGAEEPMRTAAEDAAELPPDDGARDLVRGRGEHLDDAVPIVTPIICAAS